MIPFSDPSVRLTGRWAPWENAAVATATGSSFEVAFRGNYIVLQFNTTWNTYPNPHLYVIADGGARVEVPLDRHLRIDLPDGDHVVKVILKSAMEMQHRWHHPLVAKVAFLGYDAAEPGVLPCDDRKTIEFVGDSITEGVLIDVFNRDHKNDQFDRPCMDDVCATYAWLTAEALNLRSFHHAYGAVGITRGGCGGTVPAVEGYPYCFQSAPATYGDPDYILINHGANDRHNGVDAYTKGYRALLELIRTTHPTSKIIALSAFCGAFPEELRETVAAFNREKNDDVFFIDSTGWIPPEPLHPLRDGHKIVADHLIPLLKEKYGL